MNAAVKHIVFDWNGTLLDDANIVFESIRDILQEQGGHALNRDLFFSAYHIPFETSLRRMGVPDDLADEVMKHFHDEYEKRAASAPLREGALEVLEMARSNNIRSIILSNHIEPAIHTQLARHEIAYHFGDVLAFASRATQFRDMTKGERLRRYFAQHGYTAKNAVIIGDSAEEPAIAHDQGMVGVAITGGCFVEKDLRAANPHHVIHSLKELPAILRERGMLV
jgi:phosphoglycolate phosphatase